MIREDGTAAAALDRPSAVFPGGSAEFRAESSYDIDLRTVWLLKTPF